MEYYYTQRSPCTIYIWCLAAMLVGVAFWIGVDHLHARYALLIAFSLFVTSLTLYSLSVMDQGEQLSFRMGPVPIWRLSIPYRSIAHVRTGKFAVVDYDLPPRGRNYTVWG